MDLVLKILLKGCSKDLESFFATTLAILFNKNQVIHNEIGSHPRKILEMGKNIIVDGASANDGSNSSIRVIIRDDKGHPIAALSKVLQAHYLAKVVEMLALEQGVLLAQEMALFLNLMHSKSFRPSMKASQVAKQVTPSRESILPETLSLVVAFST